MDISDSDDDCKIISVKPANISKPSRSSDVEFVKFEKTPLKNSMNFQVKIAPKDEKPLVRASKCTSPLPDARPVSAGTIPMETAQENEFRHDVDSWRSTLDSDLAEEILENLQPDNVVEQELQKIEDNLILKNGGNGTPRGLAKTCKLYEHQIKGLSWMIYMENTKGGGILADDMGLGKTIQTLALIHENYLIPSTRFGGTLIVAPLSLIRQWEKEILSKSARGLKVFVFHSKRKSKMELRNYDVVITTYQILAIDAPKEAKQIGELRIPATNGGVLFQARFRRVILDESQIIKNRLAAASKACGEIALKAQFCFSLSGTPIQNSVDDIYPQFRFIKHPTFMDYDVFNNSYGQKIQKENLAACREVIFQLQTILKSCLLRRTKATLVVKLPEKVIANVSMDLSAPEKLFYRAVELQAALVFESLDKRGIVMKELSSVLVLLLRLRQAVTHCHLFKDVWDYAAAGQFSLGFMDYSRRRIIEHECPVCMDEIQNAIQTPCSHVYCKDCIDGPLFIIDDEENTDTKKSKSCQICAMKFDIRQLVEVVDMQKHEDKKAKKSKVMSDLGEKLAFTDSDEISGLLKSPVFSNDIFKRILYTLHPDGDFKSYISSTKTAELVKILKQIKKEDKRAKTAVFSQWTGFLDLAQKELQNFGIKCLRYDGSMNNTDREAVLEKFSISKEENVLLISLKAGGVGLNLTSANNVVMLDLWCKILLTSREPSSRRPSH